MISEDVKLVSVGTCMQKKRYQDRKAADARIAQALQFNVLLRRYRCTHCDGFHVTSKSRKQYLRSRNQRLAEESI